MKSQSFIVPYNSPSIHNSDIFNSHETLLYSQSVTVGHEADGTKQIGISASWKFNGNYSGVVINTITASDTVTLDPISVTPPTDDPPVISDVSITPWQVFGNTLDIRINATDASGNIGVVHVDYNLSDSNGQQTSWGRYNSYFGGGNSIQMSEACDFGSRVGRGQGVWIRVHAWDTSGQSSGNVDNGPYLRNNYPSPPSSVIVTSNGSITNHQSGSTVQIQWDSAVIHYFCREDPVSGYDVQYRVDDGNWVPLFTDHKKTYCTHVPSQFISGKTLTYRIRSKNTAFGENLASDWVESNSLSLGNGTKIKIDGTWTNGIVFVKQNGQWRQGRNVYVKQNGVWKLGRG